MPLQLGLDGAESMAELLREAKPHDIGAVIWNPFLQAAHTFNEMTPEFSIKYAIHSPQYKPSALLR